jgi:hypothetical protein
MECNMEEFVFASVVETSGIISNPRKGVTSPSF